MERTLVTMRYFETYYYANLISNLLSEPFAYLRHLNSWHEDREAALFLAPFPKFSLLHDFATHIIELLIHEQVSDVSVDAIATDRSAELWVDQALRHHGFSPPGFRRFLEEQNVKLADLSEDHIADYHNDLLLSGDLEKLIEQLTAEVFFVVFSNRTLLANLNSYVAGIVRLGVDGDPGDGDTTVASRATRVKRAAIPAWAKNAVFFRDRGLCVQCLTNLSGLLTAQTEENYDHIVPLNEGGVNDVTNLQLLCGSCNRAKGGRSVETPNRYETWY